MVGKGTTTLHPFRLCVEGALILKKRSSFLLWLPFLLLIAIPYLYHSNPLALRTQHDVNQSLSTTACDLFTGKWVRDFRPHRYTNITCPTIPGSKNCIKYGKDQDYINWTWKPEACDLLRLDATDFLNFMRGNTLAFVGDSVARNQMESLLCLLSQGSTPILVDNDIVNGEKNRYPTWHFPSHNFTLKAIWTRYLVQETERIVNGSGSKVFDLDLDKLNPIWVNRIHKANYIVVSGGHWFFRPLYLYQGGKRIGCVYCNEENDLGTKFALTAALRISLGFLSEREGTVKVLRTFTTSHFEGGDRNGGGYCNRTEPLGDSDEEIGGTDEEMRRAQVEEVGRLNGGGGERFVVVDVTTAMSRRADAHPGIHMENQWVRGYSDCTHWCMPGPVDVWNDMLLALLKRRALIT